MALVAPPHAADGQAMRSPKGSAGSRPQVRIAPAEPPELRVIDSSSPPSRREQMQGSTAPSNHSPPKNRLQVPAVHLQVPGAASEGHSQEVSSDVGHNNDDQQQPATRLETQRCGTTKPRSSMLVKVANLEQKMKDESSSEPAQCGFQAIVEHKVFSTFITFVIISYSVYVGIETDFESAIDNDVWLIFEVAFSSIFGIELLLRLGAYRSSFFFGESAGWNIFDFVLVVSAFVDTFVLMLFLSEESDALGIVSALRILRLLRLARIFRLLRFVKELWLLLAGVIEAMRTLVWAMMLILMFIFVCGILVTQTIGHPHAGEPCHDDFLGIDALFGTVPISMFTLFAVVTTDQWADIARCAMMYEQWSWLFFLIFLACTSFAMMNVIVAVIVEATMEQASQVKGDIYKKEEAEKQEAIFKIGEVFTNADQDGNGLLTRREFMAAVSQKDVQMYLLESGIDLRVAGSLFDLLDVNDSGSLDADEFVRGAMKARGMAKAKDVLSIQCDMWRFEKRYCKELIELKGDVSARCQCVDKEIEFVRTEVRSLINIVRKRLASMGRPTKSVVTKSHGKLLSPPS
eukprot:gnl/MRDRNA2_/MRDRNA2_106563_c0_seq1.p1 gnl/MRDRNA2_/MRDRNA2_106563_c0~~gnl/MRDRNA2_/MRDRNA2_106563_c0_seq1.p1  ORF type:complete len:574 (+),score=108.69 gnl/MRDRNA2_/MRDRNA2_106563_c0_seq1:76-1797(+)